MNRFIISELAPWYLTGALALIGIIAITQIRTLLLAALRLPTALLLLFAATIIIGTAVRFTWVPNVQRIYFDEDRYLMYAVAFGRTGKALGIQIATPTQIIAGDPDPGARVTVPLIHGWIMRLFGYTDQNLFITAKIGSALQIILIFIFVSLVFTQPIIALTSAVGIALLPIMVFWSTTTNLDSLFVFFALTAGIGTAWYAKRPSIMSSLFFVASMALLLFVRIEGMLFLLTAAGLWVTLRKEKHMPVISRTDIWTLVMLAPILITRVIVALPLFSQTWCCAEATPLEIFQLGYFWRNTVPNLQTLFVQKEFPFIITICALFTAFALTSRRDRYPHMRSQIIWVFVLWIVSYFFLYSFYYVGIFYSYTFSGSYGRFFLMLVPPLLILAGVAIEYGHQKFITASYKQKTQLLLLFLVGLLTLYPTVISYRTTITLSPWDRLVDEGPRLMRKFLTDDLIPATPKNAVIIHPLTGSIVMSGRQAVSIEAFVFQQKAINFVKKNLAQGVPVYMLATDVCEATPYKCTLLGDTFVYTRMNFPTQHVPGFGAYKVTLNPNL